MVIPLVSLVIGLVVILLGVWAVRTLCAAFSVGEPITTVIYVILVVIVILWLLSLFGSSPIGSVRLR